jgi:hypothetical protein
MGTVCTIGEGVEVTVTTVVKVVTISVVVSGFEGLDDSPSD